MYHSYLDVMTNHLGLGQVCPPLFVFTAKFLYSNFGLNHQVLNIFSLLCSCFAVIFLPITIYKVCKSKIAALIGVLIIVFNPHFLYFTQRLKQYPSDISLTIFLIWLGCIVFSKSVSKRKIILFTLICIFCAGFSYTSVILTACLWFYYLFLFEKDNIKTKIFNFLIFIILWLLIFVPYMKCEGIDNLNDTAMQFWSLPGNSHIENFQHFKLFICYLFGSHDAYNNVFQPVLSFSGRFWYLFIPILIGTAIIFIKRDKYLFSVLILPVIASQILGFLHIYPCTNHRISLWMLPVFIILFVLPTVYIKFEKKTVYYILSGIIIIYYLFLFDKASFLSIRSMFNDYNYQQNTINLYFDELRKSDITENDVIYVIGETMPGFWEIIFEVFDKQKEFDKNQKLYSEDLAGLNPEILPLNKNIYFYLYKDGIWANAKGNCNEAYGWLKENVNILYEYENDYGDKFIKARRK